MTDREQQMLALYKAHMANANVSPERIAAIDSIPSDLRDYYGAIVDGHTPRPAWAETMAEKVAHVRAAGQSRPHTCHWPGCDARVPPAKWGCRKHWFMLPAALRSRIWEAYRKGQEEDGRPSRLYLERAREAQHWIKRNYPDG